MIIGRLDKPEFLVFTGDPDWTANFRRFCPTTVGEPDRMGVWVRKYGGRRD